MNSTVTKIERETFSHSNSYLAHRTHFDDCHQNEDTSVLNDTDIRDFFLFLRNDLRVNLISQPRLIKLLSLYISQSQENLDFPSFQLPESYFSILSGILLPRGFEATEVYLDKFSGFVVDYFSNEERVTCIVSAAEVQILAFLRGEFKERIFERTRQSKVKLEEFVIGLFDGYD